MNASSIRHYMNEMPTETSCTLYSTSTLLQSWHNTISNFRFKIIKITRIFVRPEIENYCWDNVIASCSIKDEYLCAYDMVFSCSVCNLMYCTRVHHYGVFSLDRESTSFYGPYNFVVGSVFFPCIRKMCAISDCHKNAHKYYTELHRNKS